MALEHALLIALREREQAGLELARRFERSIGFFWHATHQQIYRVLGRMEHDGWVSAEVVTQSGRPDKKVYAVTRAGRDVLAAWLAQETPLEPLRSELALKMRGAEYGDREAVRKLVAARLADHHVRLDHYRRLAARDYPDPSTLDPHARDHYLVLRGGIRLEEFWIDWLTDYLEAHRVSTPLDRRDEVSTSLDRQDEVSTSLDRQDEVSTSLDPRDEVSTSLDRRGRPDRRGAS